MAGNSNSAEVQSDYADVFAKLDAAMQREQRIKPLPALSICLVDNGKIVGSRGYGVADIDATLPVTERTIYRVGSVSKLFTDMAIMQLVAAGKLDLDADIQTYLPDFKPKNSFGVPITLRQLMSHQSGLVREPPVGNYFDNTEPTIAATVASLNGVPLVYKPGTRTKYSNAAIAVVGQVVERVGGKPYAEYMQEHLLRPMKMNSSTITYNAKVKEQLAAAYMWSHHAPPFPAPVFALGTAPAGNLYATVDDLGNFLCTIFAGGTFDGNVVLPQETLATMLGANRADGDEKPQYGIGFRLGDIDGHPTFGHGGAVYGYATQFSGLPEEKIGVAVAASLDCANGFTNRLGDYATRLLLARRAGKPLFDFEMTTAVDNPKQYVGTYQSDDEVLHLEEFGGSLYLKKGFARNELRQQGEHLVVDDVRSYGTKLTANLDAGSVEIDGKTWQRVSDKCPPAAPARWEGLIGEYGWDHNTMYIYEQDGQLWTQIEWFFLYPLKEIDENRFAFPDSGGLYHGEEVVFTRDANGRATEANAANVVFKRRAVGELADGLFTVTPRQPVEELRKIALADTPPPSTRPVRKPDLVELRTYNAGIAYDIRYAGKRNFMQTPFYDSAHAFLQRPAAEALVRVHKKLDAQGFGLLIHDGYRPWYVTKMFWDGVPDSLHDFVADPLQGSRHNRGCAVDLTLVDKATGKPIEMVAAYDEFSPRSYPLYPGGDSRQRWHRRLLRTAMESEGFTIYEFEWWHFDYDDWQQYPVINRTFEELLAAPKAGTESD